MLDTIETLKDAVVKEFSKELAEIEGELVKNSGNKETNPKRSNE